MKFLGRFIFGLLVMVAGLNVFLFSYVDMTASYLLKYGNQAIEAESDTFFKSIYGYYDNDYLIDEDIVGDYNFRLWAFVGSNTTENHIRIQIKNKDGLTLPENYFIRLTLEGDETIDILFQDTQSKYWHASSLNLKAFLAEQSEYLDIVDLQIIESEEVTVDNDTETVETILYDFPGALLLASEDMDILALAEDNTEAQMLALGYTKGTVHDFFKEYQYILWRNVTIFIVIVGLLTYLLFFRKRRYTTHSVINSKEPVIRENLNTKAIEEIKSVDSDENNNPEK
jgi:hypothetical protein